MLYVFSIDLIKFREIEFKIYKNKKKTRVLEGGVALHSMPIHSSCGTPFETESRFACVLNHTCMIKLIKNTEYTKIYI